MGGRTPLKAVQCTHKRLLIPNDDQHERARARGARAGSIRRNSAIVAAVTGVVEPSPHISTTQLKPQLDILINSQVMALVSRCLQLDQEDKITVRNTWDLDLINYLSTLLFDGEQPPDFQKASCILEAAAKIYAKRVDSVHLDSYKVLGTLGRMIKDDKGVMSAVKIQDDCELGEGNKHEPQKVSKQNTAADFITLQGSVESLNIKSSEDAKPSDPVLSHISAQYFKGGAQGLLLNNLSVYRGCEILVDPWEVPEKRMTILPRNEIERNPSVNLSSMKDVIQQMMVLVCRETEISPTLKKIVNMLNDPCRTAAEGEASNNLSDARGRDGSRFVESEEASDAVSEVYDHVSYVDYEQDEADLAPDLPEVAVSYGDKRASALWDDEESLGDGEVEDVRRDGMCGDQHSMVQNLIFLPLQSTEWAGSAHWKYGKKRGDTGVSIASTRSKALKKEKKKLQPSLLDFEHPPDVDYVAAFSHLRDIKSADLTRQKNTTRNLLLEDVHYDAMNLTHYFLQPSVACMRATDRQSSDKPPHSSLGKCSFNEGNSNRDSDDFGYFEHGHSDLDDPFDGPLLPVPYKVQKIDVNYNSSCAVVDVHRLKETLWEVVQDVQELPFTDTSIGSRRGTPFQKVLDLLPADCAGASADGISVPMCFMCLLQLANEHHLCIQDCPTMDDLRIFRADTEAPIMTTMSEPQGHSQNLLCHPPCAHVCDVN